MKKLLTIAITALAFTGAQAQDAPVAGPGRIDTRRLRFGAYLAPNMSWMRPTASTDDTKTFNVQNEGSRIGFTYGLMVDYFFAENYGIVTGLQVNSTGGNILTQRVAPSAAINTVNTADFEYKLQFLEIPLALKLRTDEINKFRFFGQLGVSLGFNIAKKANYTVQYIDNNGAAMTATGENEKLTGGVGSIAPAMLQMNIGAGAEYPLTAKLSAYVGLFFNNGFLPDATKPNLFNASNLGYSGDFRDANTRLNNFALRLGLFF